MPIYHFHSADGERVQDRDGIELADDREARTEAVRFAGAALAQAPDQLWDSGHWRVEVTDHDDELLFTVITLAVAAPKKGTT